MKPAKYRVEAFIIPVGNDYCTKSTVIEGNINDTNDKSKTNEDSEEWANNISNSIVEELKSIQNEKNGSISIQESIWNPNNLSILKDTINTDDLNCLHFKLETSKLYACNILHPSNSFKKVNTLISIDEKNEDSDEKHDNLCYHGCRNGCSAIVPAPQEVSEEIFTENWLQRLETIKQREAALRGKEILLQNRERSLFKREREVRITERLLKDKLKQVDLYLKNKSEISTIISNGSSESQFASKEIQSNACSKNDNEVLQSDNTLVTHMAKSCVSDLNTKDTLCDEMEQSDKCLENISMQKVIQEKSSTCGSSCSLDSNPSEEKKLKCLPNLRNSRSYSKASSHNSNKTKKSCKVYYEDLDTTLSADIGDSSFVQTSQKFNPDLYRKPIAFTRSASERRVKRVNRKGMSFESHTITNEDADCPSGIEQNKILKRFTENITASQDKSTKYQHYGLIDKNINSNKFQKLQSENGDDKKYSYLNLEMGEKINLQQKLGKSLKDRPVSWNEVTNDWLQKKREAYNLSSKRMPVQDLENKENIKCNTKIDRFEKISKKKDIRNKILTIFR